MSTSRQGPPRRASPLAVGKYIKPILHVDKGVKDNLGIISRDRNTQEPVCFSFRAGTDEVDIVPAEHYEREYTPTIKPHGTEDFIPQNPPGRPPCENMLKRYVVDPAYLNDLLCSPCSCRATGSVDSIIRFGRKVGFGPTQRVLFEMLTSSCIQTYVWDAMAGTTDLLLAAQLHSHSDGLRRLARYHREENATLLRLFASSPAGSGSTLVLLEFIRYMKEFCKMVHHQFNDALIRIVGPYAQDITGSQEFLGVKRETIHKAFQFNRPSWKGISPHEKDLWNDTRMVIVLNCSSVEHEWLKKMSEELESLTNHPVPFGFVNVAFFGDLMRLPPIIRRESIYNFSHSPYWEGSLNALVEMDVHPAVACDPLGRVLASIRENGVTESVKERLDCRVGGNRGITGPIYVESSKIVTYTNLSRKNWNDMSFMAHLVRYHSSNLEDPVSDQALVVKGNLFWKDTGRKLRPAERKAVFCNNNCKSEVCTYGGSFSKYDCLLKLVRSCEVILGDGRHAGFESVVLKKGRVPHKIQVNGYWVNAVNAEDVDFMNLKCDLDGRMFSVRARTSSGSIRMNSTSEDGPKSFRIFVKIHQFAVQMGQATTGHKFRGLAGHGDFYVAEMPRSDPNWIYSVLSMAKTIDQVHLSGPIPEKAIKPREENLVAMMSRLREAVGIPVRPFTSEERLAEQEAQNSHFCDT